MLYALLVAALVILDQLVKWLVTVNIPLYGSVPLIPHLVELTHYQNTGAAFSLFAEHTWILAVLSAVVSVVLIVALVRRFARHTAGMVCIAVVLAGALGNLIDRVRLGYVVDMFQFLFVNFAVFNVADICVTLGGIATCVYLTFFYDRPLKQSDDQENSDV